MSAWDGPELKVCLPKCWSKLDRTGKKQPTRRSKMQEFVIAFQQKVFGVLRSQWTSPISSKSPADQLQSRSKFLVLWLLKIVWDPQLSWNGREESQSMTAPIKLHIEPHSVCHARVAMLPIRKWDLWFISVVLALFLSLQQRLNICCKSLSSAGLTIAFHKDPAQLAMLGSSKMKTCRSVLLFATASTELATACCTTTRSWPRCLETVLSNSWWRRGQEATQAELLLHEARSTSAQLERNYLCWPTTHPYKGWQLAGRAGSRSWQVQHEPQILDYVA